MNASVLTAGRRAEVLQTLDRLAGEQQLLLTAVNDCWQPQDFLPDIGTPDWIDRVSTYREAARGLPNDLLFTLVGNMVTEEALPSYHAWLVNLEDGFDRSGVGEGGLARWIRSWVAEEKRHGDVLARYLYVTGRVDMRAVECTVQHLLANGFDPLSDNSAFAGFIYTAFQERATYIAHSGVGHLARQYGDQNLAKICTQIASDEVRHGRIYESFVACLFEIAPDETVLSLADMLRKTIVMPARNMTDGIDEELFGLHAAVAQRNGVYTAADYARIMDHLVRLWRVDALPMTRDDSKRAQEYCVKLPARYVKLAERVEGRAGRATPRPVSWLRGAEVLAG